IGGIPDLIEHKINGYLATPYSADNLCEGITWLLEDDERRKVLAKAARNKIKEYFSMERIAKKYIDVYRQTLNLS
ncbi:MAG TPA: glycosyl transferase, partial [Bacteroidales bacterium]|nr:glycosyl transferase [Bacteroidales bacterium]